MVKQRLFIYSEIFMIIPVKKPNIYIILSAYTSQVSIITYFLPPNQDAALVLRILLPVHKSMQ